MDRRNMTPAAIPTITTTAAAIHHPRRKAERFRREGSVAAAGRSAATVAGAGVAGGSIGTATDSSTPAEIEGAAGEATADSPFRGVAMNRYPFPVTVRMNRGFSGSSL